MDSPVMSFLRFLGGFLLFISLSFGLTFGASKLAARKDAAQQTAAALTKLLEQHPGGN